MKKGARKTQTSSKRSRGSYNGYAGGTSLRERFLVASDCPARGRRQNASIQVGVDGATVFRSGGGGGPNSKDLGFQSTMAGGLGRSLNKSPKQRRPGPQRLKPDGNKRRGDGGAKS